MQKPSTDPIAEIVDVIAAKASDAEKQEIHANMTAYLSLLYEIYCRMDGEGLLDGDSPERKEDDIVGVA